MIESHPLSRRRRGARCGRPGAGRALFIKLGTSSTASRPAAAPMRAEISSPRIQALMFEAARRPAARLKLGCDRCRVRRGDGVPNEFDAQLYWKLGSSHGDGEHSPLLLKKND